MTELYKYDILKDELNSLEKLVVSLVSNNRELIKENAELKIRIKDSEEREKLLEIDNEDLRKGSLINSKEKENLKLKITELVSKIDNHIRS